MTHGNFKGHVDDNGRSCNKCKEYKLWSEFNKQAENSTGYRPSCRECDKKTEASYERDKAKQAEAHRRYYERNKERLRAEYFEFHEENKERNRARGRDYYRRNREKLLEYQRQYYAKKKNQGE